MKNSIFNAVCKTRYLALLVVLIFTCGNVWGATTVTIQVSSDTWTATGTSGTGSNTSVTKSGISVSSTKGYKDGTTAIRDYQNSVITISSTVGNISSIAFTCTVSGTNDNGPSKLAKNNSSDPGSYSYSGKVGTWSFGSGTSTVSSVKLKATAQCRWTQVVITYTAAAGTSVTASPSSIAFPDNTVEVGTDEATSTITLSNGYASYGNYLYGWFEDLSDEDHCEFYVNDDYTYSYSTSGNATPTLTFSYLADAAGTYTGKFIIQGYNSSYTAVNCTIPLSVTLTSSCSSAVSIATGSPTNCTISASAASVSTCSGTRQVTISVTPNSCYAAPVKASVTSTGTTATWVSGPTLNSGHYDYVYSFAENATGTTTFNASLSTKTTYTVRYETGATTCTGSNAISGSHANDTKTCGSGLTLPGATFTTTGYTQTGWSKTSCGSQYAAVGGSYTDNAAQTFYPVWTPNNYTVTWMVNGEAYTTGTPSDNANYGTKVTKLPTAPTPLCGDVFVGWSTTNIGSTGLDKDDDAAAITALNLFTTQAGSPIITGNTVFYAVFADYAE